MSIAKLPSTLDSILVRTDFSDENAWSLALAVATAVNEDGFQAYVRVVDDPIFENMKWQDISEQVLILENHAAVLFIADEAALLNDYPIQVVDLSGGARQPFRCIARELWGVENNLNTGNMDWSDFADNVDSDGVFRKFA